MKIVLETQNLTKRYGDLVAVQGLTLQVHEGEVFGFLGPNGAGKTTSIHMMCGLLKPDTGRVVLHGVPIDGGDRQLRARVGMCPQQIVVWERLTCIEQLQYIGQMYGLSGRTARQRGDQLLEELDLAAKRNKQARTLSLGLQRRLNLALALVHDPEIVVLDEAEAGLDAQSRVRVREYIKSLAHQKTVIMTTHNMDEAERLADRVAIIDNGLLLALDTPAALKGRFGEGDVLEIQYMGNTPPEVVEGCLDGIEDALEIRVTRDTLTLRTLNAINLLPTIQERLSSIGIVPGEVRLRQNTLEDVFIQLTGRRLRQ